MSQFYRIYPGIYLRALQDIRCLDKAYIIRKDEVFQVLNFKHFFTFVGIPGIYPPVYELWEPANLPAIDK